MFLQHSVPWERVIKTFWHLKLWDAWCCCNIYYLVPWEKVIKRASFDAIPFSLQFLKIFCTEQETSKERTLSSHDNFTFFNKTQKRKNNAVKLKLEGNLNRIECGSNGDLSSQNIGIRKLFESKLVGSDKFRCGSDKFKCVIGHLSSENV